jgi:hypothetical protein
MPRYTGAFTNTPTPMIPPLMRPVATAYGRALRSQLSVRMLLLSIIPFVLSVATWGVLLYYFLQPLIDTLFRYFTENGSQATSTSVLAAFGMGALKTFVPPLVAMLLLLPLMILTALLFMGVAAMPAIARHVGQRQFPDLEKKAGGSLLGSVANNVKVMLAFLPLWLLSLPLYIFAPVAVVVQAALWGWLTSRVMAYDALADYASEEERVTIMATRRRSLMAIGVISGLAGALPGIVWIGGAVLWVVLFPFLAALSIWLYLMIFIFTGLWFQYFCLQALVDLRAAKVEA